MGDNKLEKRAAQLCSYLWKMREYLSRLQAGCGMEGCTMSIQELKAVDFLGRFGPAKMKSVADHLMLAVSSTTALVDNLEEKGLVVRKRSTEDRRVVLVELTKNGTGEFARAAEDFLRFGKNILKMFEEEDQERLLELLGKIHLNEPAN